MKKLLIIALMAHNIASYSMSIPVKIASVWAASCAMVTGKFIADTYHENMQDFDEAVERKKQIAHDHLAIANPRFNIKELNVDNARELEQLHALNAVLEKAHETMVGYTLPGAQVKTTTLIAQSKEGVFCGGIGYILREDHVWIGSLAVHPDYRRQGIAKQLMKEVEKRHPDKQELRLLVSQDNSKAMSTYDALGFE